MSDDKSVSVFRRIRESGDPFLDNSARIPSVIRYDFAVSACLAGPCGFGKSAYLSMAAEFFDFRKDSRALFEGLEIAEDKAFCAEHMNRHPVIFLQLKDFVFRNKEEGLAKWANILAETIMQFPEVLEGDLDHYSIAGPLSEFVSHRPSDTEAFSDVLRYLVHAVNLRFGHPILLVDDCDVPSLCAERLGLGRDFTDIWTTCLERAVCSSFSFNTLNGIMVAAVKPPYISSSWSGDRVFERMIDYSLIRSHRPMISLFDEPHVKELLEQAGAAERFDELVRLCGGYETDEGRRLVHSASVIAFLNALKADPKAEPVPIKFDDELLFDSVLNGCERRTAKTLGKIIDGDEVWFDCGIPLTLDQSEMTADTTIAVMIHCGVLSLKENDDPFDCRFSVGIPNESARNALNTLRERLLQTVSREPVSRRGIVLLS